MHQAFTKAMARNIYYGGSIFFILLFLVLTFHTTRALPALGNTQNLTEEVARGKRIWEENNCIGCHTLLGEGAYFAPELGNVYKRRGPEFIRVWMKIQPTKVAGRRQMPNFHLTDQEIDDLIAFLKWTSGLYTSGWPPNIEG